MLYAWRSPQALAVSSRDDRVLANREFSWKSFLNDLDLPRASAEGRAR